MATARYSMGIKRQSKPQMSIKRPVKQPTMGPKTQTGYQAPTVQGAAPGAAAPGTAPPSTAMPLDPTYEAAMGIAQRNQTQQLALLGAQRQALGQQYGYGVNAAGGVFDDPSNPYSRAAVLQVAYENHKRGNTNGMAARGQLYAGSLQNAQNDAATDNSQARDQLIREFLAANSNISQAELAARNAYEDDVTNAGAARLDRAVANRPDAASVPAYAAPPKPKPKPPPTHHDRPKRRGRR